jgi:hypothetical protein
VRHSLSPTVYVVRGEVYLRATHFYRLSHLGVFDTHHLHRYSLMEAVALLSPYRCVKIRVLRSHSDKDSIVRHLPSKNTSASGVYVQFSIIRTKHGMDSIKITLCNFLLGKILQIMISYRQKYVKVHS